MPELREVSAAEAIDRVKNGTWLIDVREQDEWDRGHSPLAHLVPMSRLNEQLAEVPQDQEVLVVCHAGGRSLRVTKALLAAGYDAVNVGGGMLAWNEAGGELVAEGDQQPTV